MGSTRCMGHFFIPLLHLPLFSHVVSAEHLIDVPLTEASAPVVQRTVRELRARSYGGKFADRCGTSNVCGKKYECKGGFCDFTTHTCLKGGKKLGGEVEKKNEYNSAYDCMWYCYKAKISQCNKWSWTKGSCFWSSASENTLVNDRNSVSHKRGCTPKPQQAQLSYHYQPQLPKLWEECVKECADDRPCVGEGTLKFCDMKMGGTNYCLAQGKKLRSLKELGGVTTNMMDCWSACSAKEECTYVTWDRTRPTKCFYTTKSGTPNVIDDSNSITVGKNCEKIIE